MYKQPRRNTYETSQIATVIINRDRNHPSVVIWSSCNEVECFVGAEQNLTNELMRRATKQWDTTRPLSSNTYNVKDCCSPVNSTVDDVLAHLDVNGFSHAALVQEAAVLATERWPERAIVSSECCSCETQRGEIFRNASAGKTMMPDATIGGCLENCMGRAYPYWPDIPNPILNHAIAGVLGVWTLFDYAGEPGIYIVLLHVFILYWRYEEL